MFDRLLESRSRRERRIAATTASVAMHAAIVLVAVAATLKADPRPPADPVPDDRVIWVDPPSPTDGSAADARGGAHRAPPRNPEPREIDPGRIDIVLDILPPATEPRVDLGATIGSTFDRSGSLIPAGPDGAGSGALAPGGVFTRASVERVASLRAGNPTPRYPERLRAAGREGRVDMRFVVDTLGRVEPGTPTVLASSDPLFTAAVRDVLPRLRFAPATMGGRTVRMMVEMPFVFRVERR